MVDSTKFKTREEPVKPLFGQFERSLPDSNEVTPTNLFKKQFILSWNQFNIFRHLYNIEENYPLASYVFFLLCKLRNSGKIARV